MYIRFSSIFFIAIFLTACATQTLKLTDQEKAAIRSEVKQSNKSLEVLIEEYDNKLSLFGPESFALYAPKSFELASLNYSQAKDPLTLGTKDKRKFHILAAHHLLNEALGHKSAVKLHLKNADTHFLELQKLNTPTLLPKDFALIKQRFSELILLIEDGNAQLAISSEAELIELMIKVEIQTLIETYMGETETFIANAKANGAESYAPMNLKKVESMAADIKNFIGKNYRDRSSIINKSNHLSDIAEKLYYISLEAKAVNDATNEANEKRISNQFEFLEMLTNLLELKPLELNNYATMTQNLAQQVINLRKAKSNDANINSISIPVSEESTKQKPVILNKPSVIVSPETNKAVLPELFEEPSLSHIVNEEELEFDSVEMVE